MPLSSSVTTRCALHPERQQASHHESLTRAPAPSGSRKARLLAYACLVLALSALAAPAARAALSPAPTPTAVTDGYVNAIARHGDTIYLGGNFTWVGPRSGPGAAISPTTGDFDRAMPQVSGGQANVAAAAPDGQGGWYIGGQFTHVGGVPRANLAHILPNRSVDPNWNPAPTGEFLPAVFDLAVAPDETVYVAGRFDTIGADRALRNNLAALDPRTANATPWNPNIEGQSLFTSVGSMTFGAGDTLYIAGNFVTVGTAQTARNHLAAVSRTTGQPTEWNPDPDDIVSGLARASDGTIYAAGRFTRIGANQASRPYLAAISPTTANPTAWNPAPDNWTFVITLGADNTAYVGGKFNTIGANSAPRRSLAALDLSTANTTNWNPDPHILDDEDGDTPTIGALTPGPNNTLYVGGYFTSIGTNTAARRHIAQLDLVTASATTWSPNANHPVGVIATGNETIYAGGSFTSLGGAARRNLAAIDASTGAMTGWIADTDQQVLGLADGADGTVYAGGSFMKAGADGAARRNLAALDPGTGNATSWNPRPNSPVLRVAVAPGANGVVYAGGGFTVAGANNATRNGLVALDATTGDATAWNPNPTLNLVLPGGIGALTVAPDGLVYAGGNFSGIGGASRSFVAALDPNSGNATAWRPDPDGGVGDIAVGEQSPVYVAGGFARIGANSQARRNLGAVDAAAPGNATSWDPNPGGYPSSPQASEVARGADGTVYAGGSFRTIGADPVARSYLAALDPVTANATPWNPIPSGPIDELFTNGDGRLYVGGGFRTMELAPQEGFAMFEPAPAPPQNTGTPQITGAAAVGSTLTCSAGAWSGQLVYREYVWLRDGAPIDNSARTFYDVSAADAGHGLACRVTAHNYGGESSATSSAVSVPAQTSSGSGGDSGGGGDSAPVAGADEGSAASPRGTGLTPAPGGGAVSPLAAIGRVGLPGRRLLVRPGGLLSVPVSCRGRGACRGTLWLTARRARSSSRRHRAVVVARTRFSLRSGRRVGVRMRLNHAGRRLLRARRGRLRVTLKARVGRRTVLRSLPLIAAAPARRR
jgi:hypothetical protein